MKYYLEAQRETQTGTIVIGARVGYKGPNTFTLEDVATNLNAINKQIGYPLNALINPRELVGRSGDSSYRETVFEIDLSTSPRGRALPREKFLKALEFYVTELGSKMQQERVYLEYDGITRVYRVGEKK